MDPPIEPPRLSYLRHLGLDIDAADSISLCSSDDDSTGGLRFVKDLKRDYMEQRRLVNTIHVLQVPSYFDSLACDGPYTYTLEISSDLHLTNAAERL